jgi:hypothetical protein
MATISGHRSFVEACCGAIARPERPEHGCPGGRPKRCRSNAGPKRRAHRRSDESEGILVHPVQDLGDQERSDESG